MGNGRGSIAPLGGGAPGGGEVQPGRQSIMALPCYEMAAGIEG
jgi:hypothetical protein